MACANKCNNNVRQKSFAKTDEKKSGAFPAVAAPTKSQQPNNKVNRLSFMSKDSYGIEAVAQDCYSFVTKQVF